MQAAMSLAELGSLSEPLLLLDALRIKSYVIAHISLPQSLFSGIKQKIEIMCRIQFDVF